MRRINYTGYIAGSLCKSIRRDTKVPVFACKGNKKTGLCGVV